MGRGLRFLLNIEKHEKKRMGKLKLGVILQRMAFFEHRKTRKTRMDKLKLGKTLAESAENADFTINF